MIGCVCVKFLSLQKAYLMKINPLTIVLVLIVFASCKTLVGNKQYQRTQYPFGITSLGQEEMDIIGKPIQIQGIWT